VKQYEKIQWKFDILLLFKMFTPFYRSEEHVIQN